MLRSVAILLTILFACYLLVHYAVGDAKPVAPKTAPLPPLMNVVAEIPTLAPGLQTWPDGLIGCPGPAPREDLKPDATTLRVANAYPNGGGFNWSGGTGTPDEISFKGERILSKSKGGTYCCGFTFAVVMKSAA